MIEDTGEWPDSLKLTESAKITVQYNSGVEDGSPELITLAGVLEANLGPAGH